MGSVPAALEVEIVVYDKTGTATDRLSGHRALQMKGRKAGPWLKARYNCRDYRLESIAETPGVYRLQLGAALPSKRWSRE